MPPRSTRNANAGQDGRVSVIAKCFTETLLIKPDKNVRFTPATNSIAGIIKSLI